MNFKKLNKRGIESLNMLTAGAITILIAIITVSIGLQVNTGVRDSFTNTSPGRLAAWNASDAGITGLAGFADYWVSIVSIVVLVVIVGLFMMFQGGGRGIDIR